MKSVQTMLLAGGLPALWRGIGGAATRGARALLVGARMNHAKALAMLLAVFPLILAFGCKPAQDLVPPEVLVAPYSGVGHEPLWAVAPLRNESGTSAADVMKVNDALVARFGETRGLACLPMNRTMLAMRALNMPVVASPQDAQRLAATLGADAVVVGSVTAYDPYDPPKLGLTLALVGREGALGSPRTSIDPKLLQSSPTDVRTAVFADQPLSVISEYMDAANHEVLMNLKRYSEGRHDPRTALGWRSYTASMDLYTEFGAYWSAYRLLQEERLRLARQAKPAGQTGR